MPGIDEWRSIASAADPDELRERILTGYKGGKPFTPYVPTVSLPKGVDWVLDFGCGIGRNFPYLRSVANHVAGFDLEPMIARCRALADGPVDLLTHEWQELATRRFDLIMAGLVLQHVEPTLCRAFLADFARMAPVTYVLTRLQSDFGVNVLLLVAEAGVFEVEECVKVDHDPERHQLRSLGRESFEVASQGVDSEHYEVVLRSQVRAA